MRWSKLQRELYKIISAEINLQIHCAAYPMDSQSGSTELPRYWITLDNEIIFDYPKQFAAEHRPIKNISGDEARYPYKTDVSAISDLLREYIDSPKEEIFSKQFINDNWGLISILRSADRRIGMRRLGLLQEETRNIAAHKVIEARLKNAQANNPDKQFI